MILNRINFFDFQVSNVNWNETYSFIKKAITNNEKHYIAVLNANKIYLARQNQWLNEYFDNSSIILPENAINIIQYLCNRPLKAWNMGGVEFMQKALNSASLNNWSIYFLGSTENELSALKEKITNNYPGIKYKKYCNGYYQNDTIKFILEDISKFKPNILFLGLGSPKQEKFIMDNFNLIDANITIGVGGSFKVIAGLDKLAPSWMKFGLEWIYRSFQDPKKFKRYIIINTFFLGAILRMSIKNLWDTNAKIY